MKNRRAMLSFVFTGTLLIAMGCGDASGPSSDFALVSSAVATGQSECDVNRMLCKGNCGRRIECERLCDLLYPCDESLGDGPLPLPDTDCAARPDDAGCWCVTHPNDSLCSGSDVWCASNPTDAACPGSIAWCTAHPTSGDARCPTGSEWCAIDENHAQCPGSAVWCANNPGEPPCPYYWCVHDPDHPTCPPRPTLCDEDSDDDLCPETPSDPPNDGQGVPPDDKNLPVVEPIDPAEPTGGWHCDEYQTSYDTPEGTVIIWHRCR